MLKSLKYAIMLNILPPVVYLFLVLLRATTRIEHVNKGATDRLRQRGEGFLACFWHGRLLAMPFAYDGGRLKVLISRHRDGEFIARVVRYFGIGAVRGSSSRGGVASLREILAELKEGNAVAITPDGPKGPRYQIKQGLIEIARITQRPIVPITYSASKKRLFNSWDRFVLPYPFSKILFLWGDPVYVARETDNERIEAIRRRVEETLVSLTDEADRLACGR